MGTRKPDVTPQGGAGRRRGAIAFAAALLVLIGGAAVARPWDARGVSATAATAATASSAPPAAVSRIPSAGTAQVVEPGTTGVVVPPVSMPGSVAQGPAGSPGPTQWTFVPPAGWQGGTAVKVVGTSESSALDGYAMSDDGRRWVASSYLPVDPPEGHPVASKDGTTWSLVSVDVGERLLAAVSGPLDGTGMLTFRGFTDSEVEAVLAELPSADLARLGTVNDAVKAVLPPDLRQNFHTVRTTTETLHLDGAAGTQFLVQVSDDAPPNQMAQEVMAASMLLGVEPPGAKVLDSSCRKGSSPLVCARATAESHSGFESSGPLLWAWQDGAQVQATVRTTTAVSPDDLQGLFDQLASVVNGLRPTAQ